MRCENLCLFPRGRASRTCANSWRIWLTYAPCSAWRVSTWRASSETVPCHLSSANIFNLSPYTNSFLEQFYGWSASFIFERRWPIPWGGRCIVLRQPLSHHTEDPLPGALLAPRCCGSGCPNHPKSFGACSPTSPRVPGAAGIIMKRTGCIEPAMLAIGCSAIVPIPSKAISHVFALAPILAMCLTQTLGSRLSETVGLITCVFQPNAQGKGDTSVTEPNTHGNPGGVGERDRRDTIAESSLPPVPKSP